MPGPDYETLKTMWTDSIAPDAGNRFRWRRVMRLLLVVACLPVVATAEDLPLPAALKADVDFWVSIFTQYDSDEGVLHDNRRLGVVYERLDLPASLGRRESRQRISARRSAIAATLRRLADGPRDALTDDEARILALFPGDVAPQELEAAAERIRFQRGLADRFRRGLERSGRWRDHIHRELEAHGVPRDLVALPHVESSYNPDARSYVGASGIWQFTRSTGRRFMRVDHVVDERNDPFAASSAAARLLRYNYDMTGSWPLAITAYNHGLGSVRRAIRKYGADDLVRILREYDGRTFGFASRNFYVAFLAAREVDSNAAQYFPGLQLDEPPDYDTVELSRYLPVSAIAEATGVPVAEIAEHNAALQPTVWQGSKHVPKDAVLRLPRAGLEQPLAALLAAADGWSDEQLPDLFHRVRRGDTLSQIAETYSTRVSTLVALNNLGSRHRIRAGQQLRLPAAGPAPAAGSVRAAAVESAVVAGVNDSPQGASPDTLVVEDGEASTPELLSDPSDYSVADNASIVVQPLETLGHYADWLGIRTQRLRDLNGLSFREPVVVGQRLRLPLADDGVPDFESRRIAYHREQQDAFFRRHRIAGVRDHRLAEGESIWILSLRKYDVPIWLFRQYNPELDLARIRAGTVVRFPVLKDASG